MSGARPADEPRISRRAVAVSVVVLLAVVAGFAWVAVQASEFVRGGDSRSAGVSDLKPVEVVGAQETVFSWRKDACERRDSPDLPARAFRDARGRVHLIASHYVNRASIGRDLDRVRHRCRVVMRSKLRSAPQLFTDREWLASPYTLDGRTVFALIHNEYHGNQHSAAGCFGTNLECWYNAITLGRSSDMGATFRHALPPPNHLVAEVPYRYDPGVGRHYGVFSPSNIVKKDDYYYAMVAVQRYRAQPMGTCVIRTRTLADPGSWRAWGGEDFDVAFADPYRVRNAAAGNHICKPVSFPQIGSMVQSLTYNTYFGKYLLVGTSGAYDPARRRIVKGFYYSLSDDLVDWSTRKLIRETELLATYRCGDSNPVLYPSVLDPKSKSRNFETTGRRPYLYFTRFHFKDCRPTYNRDLVRVPIEFSK